MKSFLLLAALMLGVACLSHAWAADFPDISQADLTAAIAAKTVTILDVNGTDSYVAGHIPGALDYQVVQNQLADVLPKDKGALVVAYCGSPQCHAWHRAAVAAAALGYTNVKHFVGGISGWHSGGGQMETASR